MNSRVTGGFLSKKILFGISNYQAEEECGEQGVSLHSAKGSPTPVHLSSRTHCAETRALGNVGVSSMQTGPPSPTSTYF